MIFSEPSSPSVTKVVLLNGRSSSLVSERWRRAILSSASAENAKFRRFYRSIVYVGQLTVRHAAYCKLLQLIISLEFMTDIF